MRPWLVSLICMLAFILQLSLVAPQQSGSEMSPSHDDRKLAFLFMSRGHMPLEDVWREFFRWKTNSSHYTIYVHTHATFKFPVSSFFHGKQLAEMESGAGWGNMGQVRGIKRLVRAALADPLNAWFLMLSESCVPLHPFETFRSALLGFNKSVVNACDFGANQMETETRWRPGLESVGLVKSNWRKSATWFALLRSHAEVFANETKMEKGWEKVPCCDEHYLPTILAHAGLDNETTCSDGFVHVHWKSPLDSHPWTYTGEELSPELFRHLNEPVSNVAGFGLRCSGVPGVCHFTARKFAGAYKYQLLENLDLMLSDDKHGQYDGNPWDHHQDKMRFANCRVPSDCANGTFYLVENGVLRELPDAETIQHMHLNASLARPLGELDTSSHAFGPAFPSRRDGQVIKAAKHNWIFLIKDGRRHGIPNMETFFALNLSMAQVRVLSFEDLSSIVMGAPLPDVRRKEPGLN